jgi:hypothetical protein
MQKRAILRLREPICNKPLTVAQTLSKEKPSLILLKMSLYKSCGRTIRFGASRNR